MRQTHKTERTKKMKKATILILAVISIVALSLSITSCSRKNKSKNEESNSFAVSDLSTEIDSFEISTHLSPEEPSATDTEESTAEKVTETEKITEQEIILPKESLRFISYGNGTCGVSGIGSCTDLFVVIPERSPDGDIVTVIEEKAFYGNSEIKAVEIPSTVSDIGKMAFSECSALVYVSVDSANKAYKDLEGVLYSKDGTVLLAYPSACASSHLTITANVTHIADMAFFGCDQLEQIHYTGTLTEWGKINIGEMNYGLFTASVTCSAGK